MAPDEIQGPDLAGVVAAADAAGLPHVVIGGIESRCGIVDIMRGGLPPLDYETAAARAETGVLRGVEVRVAALPTLVGFKRLAGRTQDRADLEALERVNGELPIEPIPSLDDRA